VTFDKKHKRRDSYSNNYDFVLLPLSSRYRFWASLTDRYQRYLALPEHTKNVIAMQEDELAMPLDTEVKE
jgi:hypothetical protein